MTSFRNEAARVFSDNKHAPYGDTYLSTIHDNWEQTIKTIGRDFIAIFVTIGVFLLLLQAKAVTVTVLGLEIDNISLIRAFLPCLISYFAFDLLVGYERELAYSRMYESALAILYPKISDSMLANGLSPSFQSILGSGYSSLASKFGSIIGWSVVAGSPLFAIFAYVIQIAKYSVNAAIIISMVISFILISYAMLILVENLRADDEKLSRSIK